MEVLTFFVNFGLNKIQHCYVSFKITQKWKAGYLAFNWKKTTSVKR